MKINSINNEEYPNLPMDLFQKEKHQRLAIATVTTETLAKLSIATDTFPQKVRQILEQTAQDQALLEIDQLDTTAISLRHSREMSSQLEEDYEILKLKQKNAELQAKINRNNKVLEGLRTELESSRVSLALQSPNPENIQDHVRQMRQKVASYEESCEKMKVKFSKLAIDEELIPQSLSALVQTLTALRAEADTLKQSADDVLLTRDAKKTLSKLRRCTMWE